MCFTMNCPKSWNFHNWPLKPIPLIFSIPLEQNESQQMVKIFLACYSKSLSLEFLHQYEVDKVAYVMPLQHSKHGQYSLVDIAPMIPI
jgi:hypothetical protein